MRANVVVDSIRTQVSAEEWETRVNLAAAYRLLHVYEMEDMTFSHISARVPGKPNEFLINPWGLLPEEITASCLMRLDFEGNVVFNPTEFTFNPSGFKIHGSILRARSDVYCVGHTHSWPGQAVSALMGGLRTYAETSMRWSDGVSYHDYEHLESEGEEERIVEDLGSNDGMFLRNHGILACGSSIPVAFSNMYRLERACRLHLLVNSCKDDAHLPPMDMIRPFYAQSQKLHKKIAEMDWAAMLRKLDRIDPSFRD